MSLRAKSRLTPRATSLAEVAHPLGCSESSEVSLVPVIRQLWNRVRTTSTARLNQARIESRVSDLGQRHNGVARAVKLTPQRQRRSRRGRAAPAQRFKRDQARRYHRFDVVETLTHSLALRVVRVVDAVGEGGERSLKPFRRKLSHLGEFIRALMELCPLAGKTVRGERGTDTAGVAAGLAHDAHLIRWKR